MAKKTFPRRREAHETSAREVINKHELRTGQPVHLPVPVQAIIEQTIGLEILYDTIDEPPGAKVLGALSPSERVIVLNESHADFFGEVLGPERFTLAHELGHWIYDADISGQQTLIPESSPNEVFCYHRQTEQPLSNDLQIREQNANGFAACLLMPIHLLDDVDIDVVLAHFRHTARSWGVSKQALQYRLEGLGLIDDRDIDQVNFT